MESKVSPSPPGAPRFSLAIWYAACNVSILQTCTYKPQKRQDASVFALTYIFLLRSCKLLGVFVISPLPPICQKSHTQQGAFAPRALPRFIATHPSATLLPSVDFPVLPVIRPTQLPSISRRGKRASPVAQRILATMPSVPPRRRFLPRRSTCGKHCCLHPILAGSASGDRISGPHLRSLSLQPGDSPPSQGRRCRWASASQSPRHAAIQATGLDFYPGRIDSC